MFASEGLHSSEKSPLLNFGQSSPEPPSFWFRYCHSFDTLCFGKSPEDDVVSLGVKQLCTWFSVTIFFWVVSFVLIMMEIIVHQEIVKDNIELFVPMWFGSTIGLTGVVAVSVRVCRNATLVSKERRMHMRRQGTESASLFIDYDSLPLMRRLFCWNLTFGITFIMLIIAQVLFSLWYVYDEIELWHALVPIVLLLCWYLGYLYLMAFMSLTSCGFGSLAVAQMILFVLKCNGQMNLVSWTVTLIPLYATLMSAYSYTVFICVKSVEGRYALSTAQKVALGGYLVSLSAVSLAVGITVYNECAEDVVIYTPEITVYDCIGAIQYTMCTIAVCTFSLSLVVVLNSEGRALARNRGFRDPQPLSHTKEGWVPTHEGGEVYTLLLGTIELALHSPAHISQFGAGSSNLPPRSAILHPHIVTHISDRAVSPVRRTEQENKEWEGEIELLLRQTSPGVV